MARQALIYGFLIAVVAAVLYIADPYVAESPSVLAPFLRTSLKEFLFCFFIELLSFVAILKGLLHRNRIIRITFLFIVASFAALHSAYSSVVQRPLEAFDLRLMQEEAAHSWGALQAYQSIFLPRLGLFFLVAGVFWALSKISRPRFGYSFFLLFLAALIANLHFVRFTEDARAIGPTVFTVPLIWGKMALVSRYTGPRAAPTLSPSLPGKVKTLILLVDESVRGDLLSLNGYAVSTTPYLEQAVLANFGIASAATNCSGPSHLVLRTGLRPDQLPDSSYQGFKTASIFQYAHQAGYRTMLLDGQSRDGVMQNFLSRFDLEAIDVLRMPEAEPVCRDSGDCFLVEHIAAAARSDEPTFIFAVKDGVHLPYQKRYPPERTVFTPALELREGLYDRERVLNSYHNALRWAVDDFFAQLLPRLADVDYLIIYTSDHGQNILAGRSPITHCARSGAQPDEGKVPLLVFSAADPLRLLFQSHAEQKKNKATAFEVFPTLLWALGYSDLEIKSEFGPSLLDSELRPQLFYSGHIWDEDEASWNAIR